MTFRNEEHQRFYEAARFKHEGDRERLALMYLLGLDDNSRAHWRDCYDEERGLIKPNCLRCGWQTGGSRRAVMLGFALFRGSDIDIVDVMSNAEYYTYFVAALDLRFGHSRPDARPTRKESTGRPVLYTDETRQQVKNRHAAGLSIRKIAAELGMSPTTVAKLLHE